MLLFLRLQNFVDELLETLSNEGMLKKQYDRCKLHATIMNTLFRENKRPTHERIRGQHIRDRVTFDAREILKVCSDYSRNVLYITCVILLVLSVIDVSLHTKYPILNTGCFPQHSSGGD